MPAFPERVGVHVSGEPPAPGTFIKILLNIIMGIGTAFTRKKLVIVTFHENPSIDVSRLHSSFCYCYVSDLAMVIVVLRDWRAPGIYLVYSVKTDLAVRYPTDVSLSDLARPAGQPAGRLADRPTDQPTDQPADRATDRTCLDIHLCVCVSSHNNNSDGPEPWRSFVSPEGTPRPMYQILFLCVLPRCDRPGSAYDVDSKNINIYIYIYINIYTVTVFRINIVMGIIICVIIILVPSVKPPTIRHPTATCTTSRGDAESVTSRR